MRAVDGQKRRIGELKRSTHRKGTHSCWLATTGGGAWVKFVWGENKLILLNFVGDSITISWGRKFVRIMHNAKIISLKDRMTDWLDIQLRWTPFPNEEPGGPLFETPLRHTGGLAAIRPQGPRLKLEVKMFKFEGANDTFPQTKPCDFFS